MTDSKTDASKNKGENKSAANTAVSKTVVSPPATAPLTNAAPVANATNSNATSGNANEGNKGPGKGLSVFAILLSLLALGGSGFTWYQNEVMRVQSDSSLAVGVSEIGGQVSRLGDSIAVLKKQQGDVVSQAQLSTRLLEAGVGVDKQLQTIRGSQSEIQTAIKKVNSKLQSGVSDFVLDEVSQLLKLANNSALFSGDVNSSINALSLADIQLKELAEPRFSAVRKTINSEIAALRAIKVPDLEKLSAQLSAITSQVSSLPLANEPPVAETIVLTQADDANAPVNWRGELRKIWHDMINAVSIQRVDQPPKPLLVPEQRYFLNQNLLLNLNKAEVALLQKQTGVYKQSLSSSEQWLREYFDTKDADVKSVLAQLAKLKAERISVELPPITGSYDALQSIKGGQ